MGFNILYYKEVLSDLEHIKNKIHSDAKLLLNKIENILTQNPFPHGLTVKKIKNVQPPLYRLRVNWIVSYRAFYRIVGNEVYILRVIAKKDADKILRRYF